MRAIKEEAKAKVSSIHRDLVLEQGSIPQPNGTFKPSPLAISRLRTFIIRSVRKAMIEAEMAGARDGSYLEEIVGNEAGLKTKTQSMPILLGLS